MKSFFAGVLGAIGVVGSFIIVMAILGFYLAAFRFGAAAWFGWSGFWVMIVGLLLVMFLGPLGTVIIGVVGGYGAYYVWDWPLWICIVVFFPGVAFMIGGLAMSLIGSLFSRGR